MTPRVEQTSALAALGRVAEDVRDLKRFGPGDWILVRPIAPATPPLDVVDPDPLSILFLNGWTNVAGQTPLKFRLYRDGYFKMYGSVTNGTPPSIVCTLPPTVWQHDTPVPWIASSQDGTAITRGRVDPNGDVWILSVVVV